MVTSTVSTGHCRVPLSLADSGWASVRRTDRSADLTVLRLGASMRSHQLTGLMTAFKQVGQFGCQHNITLGT